MTGNNDGKVEIEISPLVPRQNGRRGATPNGGNRIRKTVWVYAERYERTNGKGTRNRNRERKRQESDARRVEWQKLTPVQQLARLDAANITAVKQRARIQVQLDKAKTVAAEVASKAKQKTDHAAEVAAKRTGQVEKGVTQLKYSKTETGASHRLMNR